MMRSLLPVAAVLSLAACGRPGMVEQKPGMPLPVKPKTALVQPTSEQLLKRPAIAAPQRVDELLSRSVPRQPDRFNMPPPDGGPAPANTTNPTGTTQPQ